MGVNFQVHSVERSLYIFYDNPEAIYMLGIGSSKTLSAYLFRMHHPTLAFQRLLYIISRTQINKTLLDKKEIPSEHEKGTDHALKFILV